MKFLLDTCVISELASKSPCLEVVNWINRQELKNIFLSVLTIGEIKNGVAKLKDQSRKKVLQAWLQNELLETFGSQIIEINLQVALKWGQLIGDLDLVGKPMPAVDSIIAAQALEYECILVTRNVDDFKNSGVQLLNPWNFS